MLLELTYNKILEIWDKMEPISDKGALIILMTFRVLRRTKLRRIELSDHLGTRKKKIESGIMSDKTLDKRLKVLEEHKILSSEMDYTEYPPGKYFSLTKKGEKIVKAFLQILEILD